MQSVVFAAGLVALAVQTVPILAWDDEGHAIVAAIAYDRLLPETSGATVAHGPGGGPI
jgi:hypothetical protein